MRLDTVTHINRDSLARDGQVVAKDLAVEWDVSEDTIRRDLRKLAAAGRLQRVHGGALPASLADGDLHVREAGPCSTARSPTSPCRRSPAAFA